MNRSRVNALLQDAVTRFAARNIHLPPWAHWTPADWRAAGPACDEIRRHALGWDLTDFGSGDFDRIGLLLFTLRNGAPRNPVTVKPYAEKIMIVREGQVTPMHYHWQKTEDIINRGGGELVLRLYRPDPADARRPGDQPFTVSVDGIRRTCQAGELVRLTPGESITLEPYQFHTFWAEQEVTIVGEVSSVNDDAADNCFLDGCGRFPAIHEDEPAAFCLCTEYPAPGAPDAH